MAEEIPGSYAALLSPNVLKDAGGILQTLGSTVQRLRDEAGGSAIFRAEPGVPMVMICDNEASHFIFNAGTDVVDRESMRVGPIKVHSDPYAGNSCPAAFSSGNDHIQSRAYTRDLLEAMKDGYAGAVERQTAILQKRLLENKHVGMVAAITDWTTDVFFDWFIGADAPDADKLLDWAKAVFQISADTPMAKVMLKAARLKDESMRIPENSLQIYHELRNMVIDSGNCPLFYDLADKHEIPRDQVPGLIVFSLVVNFGGGVNKLMFPLLCRLKQEPAVVERLFPDGELDRDYLELVIVEGARLYSQPRYFFRIAQKDFELPSSGGTKYAVKKGERLGIVPGFAFRDPKFFIDGDMFRPERYEEDPSLLERTFPWGGPSGDAKNPFGCLGEETTFAQQLIGTGLDFFMNKHDWELSDEPVFSLDQVLSVGPDDMNFVNFRPKAAATS